MTRGFSPSRHLRAIAGLVAAAALVAGATACSDSTDADRATDGEFGYVVPRPLSTLNAGTSLGVATDAEKLSARLFPGAFLAGPDGQLLPNPDLVTATPEQHNPSVVHYSISAKAKYSDAQPVICDDFQLAYLASQRSDLFGSDMPLFSQVSHLECAPGAKEFTVVFNDHFGSRYRELFTPGTVLPSHSVVEKAGGADVATTMATGDEEALANLGTAWQDLFNLSKSDPAKVPTHGPYKVESRGQQGQLTLVSNPEFSGVRPRVDRINVWPHSANLRELIDTNQLMVADLGAVPDPSALGISEPARSVQVYRSGRVDTLRLDSNGAFASEESRHAFNGCVDRESIVGAIKSKLNTDTTATGLRMLPTNHPLAAQLDDVSKEHMRTDPERARQLLDGQTIRVGYLKDVPRYEVMVEAIKSSCEKSGVHVEPVALSADHYGVLGTDYDALLDTRPAFGRNAMTNVNGLSSVNSVRDVERELDKAMATLSLISEPRKVAIEHHVANVSDNGSDAGLSWNMDRWVLQSNPVGGSGSSEPTAQSVNPDAI